jgi:plasmid stabilization system protein ParE
MGLRVRWSRQSRDQLLAIRQRIREDNPAAAERMRVRIVKVVKLLGAMPGLGHSGRRRGTMEFVVSPLHHRVSHDIALARGARYLSR